jgi:hypothetical protein
MIYLLLLLLPILIYLHYKAKREYYPKNTEIDKNKFSRKDYIFRLRIGIVALSIITLIEIIRLIF